MSKTVYKSKSKTLKDGSVKTTTALYQSGKGWSKSTKITPAKTTNVNVPAGAGAATAASAVIALVVAGVNLAKDKAKSRAAHKVKNLDESVRNAAYIAEENVKGEENG